MVSRPERNLLHDRPAGHGLGDCAVDRAPDSIPWSVDGQVFQRRTAADLGGRQWVFDKPFFLILNLAVGGDRPANPDGSTGACLDVNGASTEPGTKVQLWECNGTGGSGSPATRPPATWPTSRPTRVWTCATRTRPTPPPF
ncbi:hypothetical protein GCM10010343_31480 [Streptomyces avidinii]|nr:hypothetical protein GCM10010343_31480 [Streptomyces avidinii]